MTTQEAIEYFKKNNERIRSTAIDENRTSKFMKETIDANSMAIRSLEAWEKVKEEIENGDYRYTLAKEGYGFGNVVWHENLISTNKVTEIIDKHLQEVENDT